MSFPTSNIRAVAGLEAINRIAEFENIKCIAQLDVSIRDDESALANLSVNGELLSTKVIHAKSKKIDISKFQQLVIDVCEKRFMKMLERQHEIPKDKLTRADFEEGDEDEDED